MSLIALHPKEDRYTHSLADMFLSDYIQYKVFEFSGIGYRDFKRLPWHETQEIFEKARARIAKESKIIEGLKQSVDEGKG